MYNPPSYFSDEIVRCTVCMNIFPREKEVKYSYSGGPYLQKAVSCPKCKKGHLWLIDLRINQDRLARDKYDHEHPSHSDLTKDGMHAHREEPIIPQPTFYERLKEGFRMLFRD